MSEKQQGSKLADKLGGGNGAAPVAKEETQVASAQSATVAGKPKRGRRVYQCGAPDMAPSQIVTYSRAGYEKDGVKFGAITRVLNRNEAFQFVIEEPIREGEDELYDKQVEAMARLCKAAAGEIQEVGPDAENKLPDSLLPTSPDELRQTLKLTEASRSDLQVEKGKLVETIGEKEDKIQELVQQLEAQKKQIAALMEKLQ